MKLRPHGLGRTAGQQPLQSRATTLCCSVSAILPAVFMERTSNALPRMHGFHSFRPEQTFLLQNLKCLDRSHRPQPQRGATRCNTRLFKFLPGAARPYLDNLARSAGAPAGDAPTFAAHLLHPLFAQGMSTTTVPYSTTLSRQPSMRRQLSRQLRWGISSFEQFDQWVWSGRTLTKSDTMLKLTKGSSGQFNFKLPPATRRQLAVAFPWRFKKSS